MEIDIPGFIKLLSQGELDGAIAKIKEKTAFLSLYAEECVPRKTSRKQVHTGAEEDNPLPLILRAFFS